MGEVTDEFTKILDQEVKKVKNDSSRRDQFMLYELKIMESKREARSEGIELATKLYVKLKKMEDLKMLKKQEKILNIENNYLENMDWKRIYYNGKMFSCKLI